MGQKESLTWKLRLAEQMHESSTAEWLGTRWHVKMWSEFKAGFYTRQVHEQPEQRGAKTRSKVQKAKFILNDPTREVKGYDKAGNQRRRRWAGRKCQKVTRLWPVEQRLSVAGWLLSRQWLQQMTSRCMWWSDVEVTGQWQQENTKTCKLVSTVWHLPYV